MLTAALPRTSATPAPAPERPVLVAIRTAASSNQTLDWAASHAVATDTLLVLVHAIPSALLVPPTTRYSDIVVEGRALLQTRAAALSARMPKLRVSTYLHCGEVVHALLGLSAAADLLVVGADQMNTVTGVFRGSVAIEVALGSRAPVLIIPVGHRESSARNGSRRGHVVVGVDGSAEALTALRRAAEEAHRIGAALRVVTAAREEKPLTAAQTEGIAAVLVDIRRDHPALIVNWVLDALRSPTRALLRHSRDATLLVLARHGRGARAGMNLGSVTHSLLLQPPCPTLLLPGTEQEDVPPATGHVPGGASLRPASSA